MRNLVFRTVLVGALCAALIVPLGGTAFAEGLGTVPSHAFVGSVDLFGMDEAAARAVISQEASVTLLPPLTFTAAGKTFSLEASRALTLDVDAMIAAAYAPSAETTFTVMRSCVVSAPLVAAFASQVARSIYRASRSATYYVRSGKLLWRSAVYGRVLYPGAAANAINSALSAEAASGTAQPALALAYRSVAPPVANGTLGRAILVDLSLRRLWLYDHSRLIRTYRVAIGMPSYPTPRGVFKVTWKRMNPSWGNPGSSWAANMPAYIPPGPTNPLGTRALYLSAPGIRIHGTSQTWSIGRAASHGCIRLTNYNIQALYPLVPIGTKVFIIP